jgi:hypothetical protein
MCETYMYYMCKTLCETCVMQVYILHLNYICSNILALLVQWNLRCKTTEMRDHLSYKPTFYARQAFFKSRRPVMPNSARVPTGSQFVFIGTELKALQLFHWSKYYIYCRCRSNAHLHLTLLIRTNLEVSSNVVVGMVWLVARWLMDHKVGCSSPSHSTIFFFFLISFKIYICYKSSHFMSQHWCILVVIP